MATIAFSLSFVTIVYHRIDEHQHHKNLYSFFNGVRCGSCRKIMFWVIVGVANVANNMLDARNKPSDEMKLMLKMVY